MAFRTQKISQMTPKGANLEATDLIEVSTIESGSYVTRSITGQEIIDAAVGNVDWGDIGGTLSAQTDLQSALDAKVPTTRTLTINGVTQDLSADRTFTISTGITIGSTAIASGVVGRVLFQGTGNVVQQSSSLFWDATNNRLGIGTSSPQGATHIAVATGTPALVLSDVGAPNTLPTFQFRRGPLSAYSLQIDFPSNIKARFQIGDSVTGYEITGGNVGLTGGRSVEFGGITGQAVTAILGSVHTDNNNGQLLFSTRGSGTLAERARITNTGNVLINTTTDAGFRLDVNGTARVQGQTTIAGTTNASAGLGRNTLINGTITATANNNVLVGLDIEPTFNTGAFTGVETLALRVTGFISNFTSSGATQIRIIGPSNANKSLFFFNSSSTFASTRIYNQGTTNHLVFATGDSLSNPTDRFAIFASTGNVGINTTTDAGFRLDVNGTARVQGQLTMAGDILFPSLGRRLWFPRGAGSGVMFSPSNSINAASQDAVVVMDSNFGTVSYGGGTHTFNALSVLTNINTGGSYNGIVRGYYYNPTLTSTTGVDHRAIETTSGRVIFGGLPTSSAGLPTGAIWNDAGTLKIV